jgi:hypothetical protein
MTNDAIFQRDILAEIFPDRKHIPEDALFPRCVPTAIKLSKISTISE